MPRGINWTSCEHNEHIWMQKTFSLKDSWPNLTLFAPNTLNTHYAMLFVCFPFGGKQGKLACRAIALKWVATWLFTLLTYLVWRHPLWYACRLSGRNFLEKQLCVYWLSWLVKNSQVLILQSISNEVTGAWVNWHTANQFPPKEEEAWKCQQPSS